LSQDITVSLLAVAIKYTF